MKNPISICVDGLRGSGKTQVIRIINAALIQAGYATVVDPRPKGTEEKMICSQED